MTSSRWRSVTRNALAVLAACAVAAAGCQSTRNAGQTRQYNQAGAQSSQQRGAGAQGSVLHFPSGSERDAVLRVTKTLPPQVNVGDEVTYSIVVENVSDFAVTDVLLREFDPHMAGPVESSGGAGQRPASDGRFARDRDPPDMRQGELDVRGEADGGENPIVGRGAQQPAGRDRRPQDQARPFQLEDAEEHPIGTLAPGQSRTVNITRRLPEVGRFQLCTAVTYTPVLCAFTSAIQPELSLTKTGPEFAEIGETIAYNLTVTNSGVGPARNVQIIDRLPAGLRGPDGQQTMTFDAGTLDSGQSRSFRVRATATRPGEFVNQAQARASGGLSDEATATTVVRAPELRIDKNGPAQSYADIGIPFEIAVANTGTGVARNVVIRDELPPNTRLVESQPEAQVQGRTVTWNIGDLRPEQERRVRMRIEATEAGAYTNRAVVSADNAESAEDVARFQVVGIAGLLLEVVDQHDPIAVGEEEVYTILVRNQGDVPAENIEVQAELGPQLQLISAGGASEAARGPRGIIFAPLPTLAAQANATWQIRVRGTRPGDARITVRLNAATLETPVIESEATQVFEAEIQLPPRNPQGRPQDQGEE